MLKIISHTFTAVYSWNSNFLQLFYYKILPQLFKKIFNSKKLSRQELSFLNASALKQQTVNIKRRNVLLIKYG